MSACNGIPANPDVSGIGIRVNLYTTMLFFSLIPYIPGVTTPLVDVLTTNARISGASLIITAIIQTVKGELSLYHAIFIIHMLFFLGVAMRSSSVDKPLRRALLPRMILSAIFSYIFFLLNAGWSLYIWSTVKTSGINSECNDHVRYIFFFHSVRATATWLVVLWKVILGSNLALMALAPIGLGVFACVRRWKRNNDGNEPRINVGNERVNDGDKLGISFIFIFTNGFLLLFSVYSIVMLELYVKRNRSLFQDPVQLSQEMSWSFGQVFSIVIILSTLNEMVHFGLELWWEKKDELHRQNDEACPSEEGV